MDGLEFIWNLKNNPNKAIDVFDELVKHYKHCFDAANNHKLDFMRFRNQCSMSKKLNIHQIYKNGYCGFKD